MAYRNQPAPGLAGVGEPAREIRFEAGDVVVVLGEPHPGAAEIRLSGDEESPPREGGLG